MAPAPFQESTVRFLSYLGVTQEIATRSDPARSENSKPPSALSCPISSICIDRRLPTSTETCAHAPQNAAFATPRGVGLDLSEY